MKTRTLAYAVRPVALMLMLAGLAVAPGCGSSSKAPSGPSAKAAVTGTYAFWPQFPDDPRVQFVRGLNSNDDVSPVSASDFEKMVFGKEVEKNGAINKPYGVAMRDGKIYVCDMRGESLTVLDLKNKQTRLLGTSGVNQLKHPIAVAVSDDGEIYVADNERGAIQVFDSSERYSRMMGHQGFKPAAIAIHGDRLYATDIATQVVEIYDRKSGEKIGTIGSVGDGEGQFRLPLGIAADPKGNVYVVDMMLCRVQKFAPDGKYLSGWGTLGDSAGTFSRPKHIAVDADGIVYVVDAQFQNVQMFDDKNRLLMHFGAGGSFPGAMNLPAGIGVCEDSVDLFKDQLHPGFKAKRVIVVANQFGSSKISLYAMGGLREGYTAKELAAAAAKVESGVGAPSKEALRLQTPGPEEPKPDAPPTSGDAPTPDKQPASDPAAKPQGK